MESLISTSFSTTNISPREQNLIGRLAQLKAGSGSHSPSLATMQEALPDVRVNIDACYLSNPLATDLFWNYFNADTLEDDQLVKRLFEAYPSQNRAIADRFSSSVGVDPDRIFITNGATEAIQAIIHNFSRHVHVNVPTFSPYYEFTGPQQRVTTFNIASSDSFVLDPEQYVRSVIESHADTAVLISPNNPDGYHIPAGDLKWILTKLSYLDTVILDESFIHFTMRSKYDRVPTYIDFANAFPNVTIIKSMSKDFGIAGIRAGYAVMDPARVDALLAHGYLWNINGVAEYFFSLFARPEFQLEYRDVLWEYKECIARFTTLTEQSGYFRAYPTRANFQLIEVPHAVSSSLVTTLLLIRHGVYVRNCEDKVGLDGQFLRIAIRTDQENRRILDALEDVLHSLAPGPPGVASQVGAPVAYRPGG